MSRNLELRALRAELANAAARFHPMPERLSASDELLAVLADLYCQPPDVIWSQRVEPFIVAQASALATLYDEHRVLPEVELLDTVEALLVLERLNSDPARLVAAWPLEPSVLGRLAGAWGIPLPRAA